MDTYIIKNKHYFIILCIIIILCMIFIYYITFFLNKNKFLYNSKL